jgi:predicted metal-binding protein
MDPELTDTTLKKLIVLAKKSGASSSKLINTRGIVVDKRVRLKCSVPLCSSYGRNLMCPPNVMGVDEFSEVLRLYRRAILIQVEADYDSSDKSSRSLDARLCKELDRKTDSARWQRKLHRVVNLLETEAFKKGFYLAAGLIGGECSLCEDCVSVGSGKPCRHPFEARPSLEGMGVDVIKTCQKAGMPVRLSSKNKVRWTGMVLLD